MLFEGKKKYEIGFHICRVAPFLLSMLSFLLKILW